MPQARRKTSATSRSLSHHVSRGVREGLLLILSAVALYLLITLLSYHPQDPGWSQSGTSDQIYNLGGGAGAWFADVFLYLLGYLAYLFPVMVAYSGWILFRGRDNTGDIDIHLLSIRWFGFFLTVIAGCGLLGLLFEIPINQMPLNAGGVLGNLVSDALETPFSFIGAALFLFALSLAGVTLFTGLSWLKVMEVIGKAVLIAIHWIKYRGVQAYDYWLSYQAQKKREIVVKAEKQKVAKRQPIKIEPLVKKVEVSPRVEKERQVPLFESPKNSELPVLALLDEAPHIEVGYSSAALEAMSRLLELKLQDFGVEGEVVAVQPGPIITRFELQPGQGVKVSRITSLAKDLARSLAVSSVRVVEVIAGKSVIGIEIPNEQRELISLSEILKSKAYDDSQSALTLTLGKDIGGQPVVVDLAKMPHLLVAGTTGSGKSVAVNAMILSLLYKSLPKDVRLILIDPKMLELSVYEGIPHLLTPVVTDMNEAASALRWCVMEMERRYKLMASQGVRNLANFNRKVNEAEATGSPILDPLYKREEALDPDLPLPVLTSLPHIVVVIDELADMMMVVGKKVEELIARLAQKARASGIHLILATQRPSVDVITGLIKANIPTRIAFQVSSRIDSRTILDQGGAEQLLGHGDMLYLPPGSGLPIRVHGAFVSDEEVIKVAEYLRKDSVPDYIEAVLQTTTANMNGVKNTDEDNDAETDALYDEAVRIVTETRKASISGVQRRLRIGYNRAARMVEHMEAVGIVSELQSNGSREVLAPPPVAD